MSYADPAPFVEYIAPARTVSFFAPAPIVEYIASAPAMYEAPALVVEVLLVARRVHCGLRVMLGWERCCTVCLVARDASCGFRKREDELASLTGATRSLGAFGGVIIICMLRAALHASASRIPFSPASMRDNPRHGASMPVAWMERVSVSLCILSQ